MVGWNPIWYTSTLSSIAQAIEALELAMGQYCPADLYIAESLCQLVAAKSINT